MISLVLLGGAKRVTLVEKIIELLESINQKATIYSVERDESFYPISKYAKIIRGPSFNDDGFTSFLSDFVNGNNAIPIGCMDAALPHISKLQLKNSSDLSIVRHSEEAANLCLDKRLTQEFCEKFKIKIPKSYSPGQVYDKNLIIKPAKGFGGKGIIDCGVDAFDTVPDYGGDFVYQEKIIGQETTHDIYIDSKFNVVASSRDRLAVIDGEVDHCIVRVPNKNEMEMFEKIAKTKLFWGPITVQTFETADKECYLIEINARLGGGVTASIAAGAPILENYLSESFGLKFPIREIKKLEMKRARRDFYKFID
jgi:carbamoyl-phosphate synthase large subunit